MTYSGSSSIKGQGRASADAIQAWFESRAKQGAAFVKLPLFPIPPDVGSDIYQMSAEVGINSDLVAGQIWHESAGWQSAIVRQKNNPSGLGAINSAPMAGAITFATPADGIKATIAHLLTYVEGTANPWWAFDPRATAVLSKNLGVVDVLSDLDGRWAVPGVGYGQGIAALANQLVTSGGGTSVAQHFIDVIDETHWNGPNRPGYPMIAKSITVHETANTDKGADAMMHARFVQNGGGSEGVSFHYCVDDHQAVRIVPDTENAWHAGDGANGTGNRTSIAIETCVNSDGNWAKTKQNLAKLVAQLCAAHDFTPDSAHIVQHNHWSGKDCPHIIRAEGSWNTILANVAGLLNTATPQQAGTAQPVDQPRWFAQTRHYIAHGFKAFYESHSDALQLFGYPLSEEFTDANNIVVQWFERARFEWHPGSNQNPWDVLLGRLGADAMANDRNQFPAAFADAEPPK
jgi:N-acetylmuramoyl-L-alanine amidase